MEFLRHEDITKINNQPRPQPQTQHPQAAQKRTRQRQGDCQSTPLAVVPFRRLQADEQVDFSKIEKLLFVQYHADMFRPILQKLDLWKTMHVLRCVVIS
jgi:hypothetical protein